MSIPQDCPYDGMYGGHTHVMGPRGWVCLVEPQGCSCSVNDPVVCPYCMTRFETAWFRVHYDAADGRPTRLAPLLPLPDPTEPEEKERGVLSTLKRWARAVSGWLDPHAAHGREWRQQQRADLDGGEPGPEGRER